jgi:precorrin-6B methylase 2
VPTHAYDAIVAATMRERRWRAWVANDVASRIGPEPAIVDIGAGTGSLACVLRERMPAASITAVEPDASWPTASPRRGTIAPAGCPS